MIARKGLSAARTAARRLSVLAAITLLGAAGAQAQSVAARVEVDSVSIGERISLVLRIAHDGTRRAVFPDETGSAPPEAIGAVGDFELIRRSSSGFRTLADGSRIDSVIYDATTFAVDTSSVAPTVYLATETDTLAFAGSPVFVPVRSTVPDGTEDVRDITPIVDFPAALWPWLLLPILALVAWWLWRRHRNREVEADPEPLQVAAPESPLEEALRRLDSLAAAMPASPDDSGPFFDELSDILRTYLSKRTGEHAHEMTSGELVAALRSRRTISADRIAEIEQLLRASDLVKFADVRPPLDRTRAAHGAARLTIERIESERRPAVAAEPAQATVAAPTTVPAPTATAPEHEPDPAS